MPPVEPTSRNTSGYERDASTDASRRSRAEAPAGRGRIQALFRLRSPGAQVARARWMGAARSPLQRRGRRGRPARGRQDDAGRGGVAGAGQRRGAGGVAAAAQGDPVSAVAAARARVASDLDLACAEAARGRDRRAPFHDRLAAARGAAARAAPPSGGASGRRRRDAGAGAGGAARSRSQAQRVRHAQTRAALGARRVGAGAVDERHASVACRGVLSTSSLPTNPLAQRLRWV